MKYGYVNALLTVLLLIGAAGSGKTHAKHLFLGLDPPPIRQSTPLVEDAVRSISTMQVAMTGAREMVWQQVNLEKLKQMLAGAIKVGHLPLPPLMPPHTTSGNEPSAGTYDISPQSDSSAQNHFTAFDAHYTGLLDSTPHLYVNIPVQYEQDQELLNLIKSCEGSQELFQVDWVYLIDSGGQQSFHEILPLFVHTATAVAFFLKLNEQLTDKPTIEYYDSDGQQCGSSYSSLLTNEQTLRHCVRSMQSRQNFSSNASPPSDALPPSVFVVGTHKDREHECQETRREKNSKLLEMLRPIFGDKLASYSLRLPEEVIFPLNAKTPTAEDQKIAEEFRIKVARMGEKNKLPLPWFVLELYVGRLALELHRKVLSIRECEQEALKLEMDEHACEEALVFLDKLDRLFYRPSVLNGLVFCGSQVPLDKISELIKLLHMLQIPHPSSNSDVGHLPSNNVEQSPAEAEETHDQLPGDPTNCDPVEIPDVFPDLSEFEDMQLRRLREYGIVTITMLRKFPKHYDEGLFTPTAFLKLLTAFQVAAPLSEDSSEFVMPCLLRELAPQELERHQQQDPSPTAPLLIQFPDNWVPAGVFAVLVTYLRNIAKWRLCLTPEMNPRCFYRNCVEFKLPTRQGGLVTLIDSFHYIEVHLIKAQDETCLTVCPQIVLDVITGIGHAADRLHYGVLNPEIAFFCQTPTPACKSTPHLASVEGGEWVCSVNPKSNGKLTRQHNVWFCPEPGRATKWVCSVSQEISDEPPSHPNVSKLCKWTNCTEHTYTLAQH